MSESIQDENKEHKHNISPLEMETVMTMKHQLGNFDIGDLKLLLVESERFFTRPKSDEIPC